MKVLKWNSGGCSLEFKEERKGMTAYKEEGGGGGGGLDESEKASVKIQTALGWL